MTAEEAQTVMTRLVPRTTLLFVVFPFALAAQFTLPSTTQAPAQQQAQAPANSARHVELDINGDQSWIDTKMDVAAGDVLAITASGTVQIQAAKAGPED